MGPGNEGSLMRAGHVLALVFLLGCASRTSGGGAVPRTANPQEIVAAPDRTERDRAMDEHRKPVEMLTFFELAAGMRVAELGAGGGYTTELLARAVGPGGVVFAQDTPNWDGPGLRKVWEMRLARPALQNTKHVMRQWDDPLPPEARDLDAVILILFYHDTVWMQTDRARMNEAIFNALKPGGVFGIVDHSARAGSGLADVQTLHRIEEKVVRDEVQKAGFRLAAEATFLKNPNDPRDWNASPRVAAEKRGTSDRFVLKFVKP